MEWLDILIDGYGRVPEYLGRIFEGLSREDLAWLPTRDTNPMGWLAWGMIRC